MREYSLRDGVGGIWRHDGDWGKIFFFSKFAGRSLRSRGLAGVDNQALAAVLLRTVPVFRGARFYGGFFESARRIHNTLDPSSTTF